jgi:hypothetical protein
MANLAPPASLPFPPWMIPALLLLLFALTISTLTRFRGCP